MAGKITKNFRLHTSEQFYEQFDEAAPSNIYFFIARSTPWDVETAPPDPIDSTRETGYKIWDNMLALKKVTPSDVSYSVVRNDWTLNTVYSQYTSDTEYFVGDNFYVITDDYNVYKCLSNNNGAQSSIKPTGKSTSPLTTADGYIWKYMYTVSASDALKFNTARYIPVKFLGSDDGSDQWAVQQAAVDGSISSVIITSGGSNYKEHTGTLVLGGTTTCRLAVGADGANDTYNGSTIYIASGTGAGQIRTISDYDGTTKEVTVSPAFSPAVDTSSTYVVSPKVNITGDGTGAVAYSRVTGSAVSKINMINFGSGYKIVNATITAGVGSGAVVSAQLAPFGGHGKNAVDELFGHNVMMNVKLTGSEDGDFMISNDFRTVGIIVDPIDNDTTDIATGLTYNQTTKLTLSSPVLAFTNDEVITGGTSGTTANIVEYFSNTVIMVTGNIRNFTGGETITGGTSGATATVSSIAQPGLSKYTGKLLYVENRAPVSRGSEQQEDIKMLIRF